MITKHLASEVIGNLIPLLNLGTSPPANGKWPVFIGSMQDNPDEVIGVVDTSRPPDGRIQRTGETLGHLGFQVTIRSPKYKSAREKCLELWQAFDSLKNYEISVEDSRYQIQTIHHIMLPSWIGSDPQNRVAFVLNCITLLNEV